MIRIDRYIRNAILPAMLVVLLALAGLDFVFSLMDEMGETNAQYQAGDALKYVLFTFPRHLYELLPMTALIGALSGLGVLASGNELVALRAAGVKAIRIVWAAMKPAVAVMLLGLALGEYIAPRLELQGELERALARGEQVALSRYGHWQRDHESYMHFNAIDPQGVLHGVSIYRFNERRQLASKVMAESALYQEDGDASFWLLQNGAETVFQDEGELPMVASERFDERIWRVELSPDLLKVLIIDPDKMAISDLFRYAARFKSQGQDSRPYFLSFWRKALQPLTTAALVLVAVSFIFGPLREASMSSRLFGAICFGILFTIFQRLFGTLSLVYQLNTFLAVLLPSLICALLGIVLLRRVV